MMWGWHAPWHWLTMAGLWLVVLVPAVWAAVRLFPGAPTGTESDDLLARGAAARDEYRPLGDELERR